MTQMQEQKSITPEQKHKIWTKNSGYLYDRLLVHKMKWPSLTFQWLPTLEEKQDSTIYQVLVGTHTSGERDTQHVYIYSVQFPHSKELSTQKYDPSSNILPSANNTPPASVKKVEQFNHEVQPNRARCNPRQPEFIAVRVDSAPISIYKRGSEFPVTLLNGHSFSSGFGLQWSTQGLISCDHQGSIAVWKDIQKSPTIFKYDCEVEDAKMVDANIFTSVGDDGNMCIWDLRSGKVQEKVKVSQNQVYTVAVNPVNKNLILTAGEQDCIKLWDARKYSSKLYRFDGHEKPVLSLQWSPKTPTIFASGSQDSKVRIYDLLRVGFQIPKDNSGTQQLLFTHEGHRDDVLDLGWNPYCMLLGSVQQKFNTLQIYQISNCIQELQYREDMEYLREQCLS